MACHLLARYLSCSRPSCPFLPSCTESVFQHSGAAQPARWVVEHSSQRGATLRAMENPASILLALLLLTLCPRAPGRSTAQLEVAFPLALPQFKQAGSSAPGASPFLLGVQTRPPPTWAACPRAWCPDAAPGFLTSRLPETVLGFVPDWRGVQPNKPAGRGSASGCPSCRQDHRKPTLLPPGTRQGGGWPQQEIP